MQESQSQTQHELKNTSYPLIQPYSPLRIYQKTRQITLSNLQEQERNNIRVQKSYQKQREKFSLLASPLVQDQTKLMTPKRHKLPVQEWNPCIEKVDFRFSKIQKMGRNMLGTSIEPPKTPIRVCQTPQRQIQEHNLLMSSLRPKTGLNRTAEFHQGKVYKRVVDDFDW